MSRSPVVITIYNDRSFEFITKSPPASVLLKQYAKIAKGANNAKTQKVGKVVYVVSARRFQKKLNDLNATGSSCRENHRRDCPEHGG